MRGYDSIAANCCDSVRVARGGGITQRIARRSGASTGCSGLCPLPNTSQALPNLPNSIARQAGVHLTTLYRNPLYSAYAGSTVDGGFCGKYWEGLGNIGRFWEPCRQLLR